jgi:hypothetical protein
VTCGGPRAGPSREAGTGVVGTRGSPRATLSRVAGTRAAGTCGSPRAVPSWEAGAVVLASCLYAGVPGPQGADMHRSSLSCNQGIDCHTKHNALL